MKIQHSRSLTVTRANHWIPFVASLLILLSNAKSFCQSDWDDLHLAVTYNLKVNDTQLKQGAAFLLNYDFKKRNYFDESYYAGADAGMLVLGNIKPMVGAHFGYASEEGVGIALQFLTTFNENLVGIKAEGKGDTKFVIGVYYSTDNAGYIQIGWNFNREI